MAEAAKDQDQSMEDILQSIKRIIAEEGETPAEAARVRRAGADRTARRGRLRPQDGIEACGRIDLYRGNHGGADLVHAAETTRAGNER